MTNSTMFASLLQRKRPISKFWTPKSLSPDWLRMQSDFYLCSTGLLEGRRETAFRKEKCFTKFFYDSEADWGNHRFEQWRKKRSLDMNHYF